MEIIKAFCSTVTMYLVPEYRPVDRASMQCMQNAILLWHFCLSVRPSVCLSTVCKRIDISSEMFDYLGASF